MAETEAPKPIGGRVPFDPGTRVWNRLNTDWGPGIVATDNGEEKLSIYLRDKEGEAKEFPALLLTTKAPAEERERREIPLWLIVAVLLISVGAMTGYVLSEGSFRWTWGCGFIVFGGAVVHRLFHHFG